MKNLIIFLVSFHQFGSRNFDERETINNYCYLYQNLIFTPFNKQHENYLINYKSCTDNKINIYIDSLLMTENQYLVLDIPAKLLNSNENKVLFREINDSLKCFGITILNIKSEFTYYINDKKIPRNKIESTLSKINYNEIKLIRLNKYFKKIKIII